MIMIGMQKYPLVRLSANMVFICHTFFRGLYSEDYFFIVDSAPHFFTLARDLFWQWQAANHMMASVKRSTNVLPMKHAHNIDPLERLEATRLGPKRCSFYSSAGCRFLIEIHPLTNNGFASRAWQNLLAKK